MAMKLRDVYEFLDSKAPFELAENWDNCGVLVGHNEQIVSKIFLSLDLSFELVRDTAEGSLIITHHPFIFSAIKKIDTSSQVGKIIKEAIKKDISIIALHTNYDKAILNKFFVEKILGYECFSSDNFICQVSLKTTFDDLLDNVKEKLKLQTLQYVRPKKADIQTIGITTGSGSEFIFSSGCDVYMTGDIKYHTAFDAKEQNVGLIDITHYASELCFAASLAEILNILPIEVIIANSKNPFEQC